MDPIDFNSMEKNTMEVNRDHQMSGYTHSSKYILLYSAEEKIFNRSETVWGWVNDDRIFIFGCTISLIFSTANTSSALCPFKKFPSENKSVNASQPGKCMKSHTIYSHVSWLTSKNERRHKTQILTHWEDQQLHNVAKLLCFSAVSQIMSLKGQSDTTMVISRVILVRYAQPWFMNIIFFVS